MFARQSITGFQNARALIVGTITSQRNIRFQRWILCFKVTSPVTMRRVDITTNGSALINANGTFWRIGRREEGRGTAGERGRARVVTIKIVINVW